ncbi:hypothetical protein [Tardiphaga sp.]|jgi:hypothetical protein|uniref:hypothetical protein n=1 Tax=Tardiphaga sp. TaxID=1926292 RepID=UPI0037DA5343
MDEITDEIALRWALRDIIARRHRFLRVSEAKIQRLRELQWVEDRDGEVEVTEAGRQALG